METKLKTKLVHEGDFVTEVPVVLIKTEDGWSAYLSVDDAKKLDEVREALRRDDIKSAAKRDVSSRCRSSADRGVALDRRCGDRSYFVRPAQLRITVMGDSAPPSSGIEKRNRPSGATA